MFTKKDRKIIECLSELYNSDNDYLNYLKTKYNDLLSRAIEAEKENMFLRTKVDLYEKYIQSTTDATNASNDIFMFNGEIYRLTESTIHEEAGMSKTMNADFQCMTGFTKNFKEE